MVKLCFGPLRSGSFPVVIDHCPPQFRGLAQLVARTAGGREVTSSSLVSPKLWWMKTNRKFGQFYKITPILFSRQALIHFSRKRFFEN